MANKHNIGFIVDDNKVIKKVIDYSIIKIDDEEKSESFVAQYVLKNSEGDTLGVSIDIPCSQSLPYEIEKVADYTYQMYCDTLDYDNAIKWFEETDEELTGACSSVRKGNFYGRNYDWTYDNTADFVIKTPSRNGRYATIGFGGVLGDLSAEFVESGEYSPLYKVIPFKIVDGINEKGLVCNINVVPKVSNITHTTPNIDTEYTICNRMLPRFVLDRFSTAQEAAEYIRDHVSVYNHKELREGHNYDLHMMIADKDNTYLLEFMEETIEGETVLRTVIQEMHDKAFMTNFHLSNVTFNEDGSVYTPYDKSEDFTHDPMTVNGIHKFGAGLERYNIINSVYNLIEEKSDIANLVYQSIKYTNTYGNPDTTQDADKWYSEGVGDYGESGEVTVSSDKSTFDYVYGEMYNLYTDRDRETAKTWQTVHSCVYDIENRSVDVRFQEEVVTFKFEVEYVKQVQSDWNQNDETADDYIKSKPDIVKGSAEGSIRGINTDEESSEYSLGENAVALGENTNAEGESSFATGIGAKAEGMGSTANGYYSYATGNFSQAEGYNTSAAGEGSHTEGNNTIANNASEHAQGQYNVSNSNGSVGFDGSADNTLFSIGNGTASPGLEPVNSKNAVEVMQNGDMYVQGVGNYDGKNYETAETLQDIVNKQSDWNQNDETQHDFIKNRICYEDTLRGYYNNSQGSEEYSAAITIFDKYEQVPLEQLLNRKLIIRMDDEESIIDTNSYVLASGVYMWTGGSLFGGMLLVYGENSMELPVGLFFIKKEDSESAEIQYSLPETKIVKQIDGKFIKNSDWNQNDDSESDHIKNRTHWVELTEGTSVLNDSFTFSFDSQSNAMVSTGTLEESFSLEKGKQYYITIGDESFITKCETMLVDSILLYILENKNRKYSINVADILGTMLYNFVIHNEECPDVTYDVKISNTQEDVHKIDRKFLPEISSINNLKDGSAVGSLRGINSTPESDSYTIGVNAFAEGSGTQAVGNSSHAGGNDTIAAGDFSTALGDGSTASGTRSIAGGSYSIASGSSSIAFGDGSIATNYGAVAFGSGSIETKYLSYIYGYFYERQSKVIECEYAYDTEAYFSESIIDNFVDGNIYEMCITYEDYEEGEKKASYFAVFDASTKNFTVENNTSQVFHYGEYVDPEYHEWSEYYITYNFFDEYSSKLEIYNAVRTSSSRERFALGDRRDVQGMTMHYNDSSYTVTSVSYNSYNDTSSLRFSPTFYPTETILMTYEIMKGSTGMYSFTAGSSNIASGSQSTAIGSNNTASGFASVALGTENTASGTASYAEGDSCESSAQYTHAEGYHTTASDNFAHAEGRSTVASGQSSHAEGYNTEASGVHSHAEGTGTTASGPYSHSEGFNNTTSGAYSHTEGASNSNAGTYTHVSGMSNTVDSGVQRSAIIGGVNNKLSQGATNSAIIGGYGLYGTCENTVYLPNVSISGELKGPNASPDFSNVKNSPLITSTTYTQICDIYLSSSGSFSYSGTLSLTINAGDWISVKCVDNNSNTLSESIVRLGSGSTLGTSFTIFDLDNVNQGGGGITISNGTYNISGGYNGTRLAGASLYIYKITVSPSIKLRGSFIDDETIADYDELAYSSKAFIKNKPFGESFNELSPSYAAIDGTGSATYYFNPTSTIVSGNKYGIRMVTSSAYGSDVLYSGSICSGTETSGGGDGSFVNGGWSFNWDDDGLEDAPNGETARLTVSYDATRYDGCVVYFGEFIVSKKLDEKYIPDTIARSNDDKNIILHKFYAGSIPTQASVTGNVTYTISDISKMMSVKLTGATTTITLPEPTDMTLDFKISVQQDATGGRNLIFTAPTANVYDINNANFATGTANQKCLVALSWDGVDWWMSASDYFNE